MGEIRHDVSLRHLNTFGVEALAPTLIRADSEEEIRAALADFGPGLFVLGGGSNILLTRNLDKPVLKVDMKGRAIIENGDRPLVAVGAGENWHDFVQWCLAQGMGGLENLSLIPGTVGAAPIQNIGAYGVEQAEAFAYLEAIDRESGERKTIMRDAGGFGYRDSVFKGRWRDKFVISRVFYRLHREVDRVHVGYGALQAELAASGIHEPTIHDVAAAVVRVRQSKLPDPGKLGNAGSFFKNPVIDEEQARELASRFPSLVRFPAGSGKVKVPAGWLIEQCGWKGKRVGDAGCYAKQALVLVNYGRASGQDIVRLARQVAADVEATFGIRLQPEVNIL